MSLLATLKAKGTFGATLLVTGCCIGAGMIGLPVKSALAGFMPSSLAMLLCYFFTTVTGLLLLEATLWFENKVNLPSIMEFTLGKIGRLLTLLLFLFLFYCLFVAYMDGGGTLFADVLSGLFHHPITHLTGIFTCVVFVAIMTYAGTQIVDRTNRVLLIGLVASYFTLVAAGLPKVDQANLTHIDWTAAIATIPILLICFGYQNLVPSLTYYLKKNVNQIRFAIIVGNLIPFFVYFLWDYVILGMLPTSTLMQVKEAGMVTELLQHAAQSTAILFYVKSFSLFAMLTSFLPNAVSFIHFLQDGFKHEFQHEEKNQFVLYALVFVPPLLCALVYPNLFLQALGFAGGFIDVLLFGVLPAAAVLIGRNIKKISGPYRVLGGNFTPMMILIFSIVVLILKVY